MDEIKFDYASITDLDLSNKNLNALPDLSMYTNLVNLNCTHNKLKKLENLPSGLNKFFLILVSKYNDILIIST
jgi:hypothetical protein